MTRWTAETIVSCLTSQDQASTKTSNSRSKDLDVWFNGPTAGLDLKTLTHLLMCQKQELNVHFKCEVICYTSGWNWTNRKLYRTFVPAALPPTLFHVCESSGLWCMETFMATEVIKGGSSSRLVLPVWDMEPWQNRSSQVCHTQLDLWPVIYHTRASVDFRYSWVLNTYTIFSQQRK